MSSLADVFIQREVHVQTNAYTPRRIFLRQYPSHPRRPGRNLSHARLYPPAS